MPGREKEEKEANRAIVTVLGHDKVGIIAGIAGVLADANVNILDISQTVLQEFFAMVMIVDLTGCRVDFATLRRMLEDKGEELELKVTLQHEDIFRFMHRV
ncbi:MAG: ACT domain-containing protein [Bacillota bacterium]|nr:ACT domain-containing protein [Bacillota bacterium]